MISSTYVRLVWIANEFTQVCLNADFGLVKLQMGITDDHDQLRLFSLASFVLYEDKTHIAGVFLFGNVYMQYCVSMLILICRFGIRE